MPDPHHFPAPEAAGAHPARRVPRRGRRTLRFAPGRFRQRNMPRHAHARRGRETERRPGRRRRKNFLAAVRLKPLDHNRLHVRATRYRTPRGSACSRTLRRLTLSLGQTVTRKKFSGAIPHKTQGATSCISSERSSRRNRTTSMESSQNGANTPTWTNTSRRPEAKSSPTAAPTTKPTWRTTGTTPTPCMKSSKSRRRTTRA